LYWFKWGDFLAQSAKWFNHSLRWLIYIVLLTTLIVVIVYSGLAYLEKNQDYLEQQLSQAMHTTVRMEKFNATWHGFEPEIHITGLHIYHPQYPSVVIMGIPHVKLELALWQSLLQWDVRLDGQVDGVNLNLVQDASGQWAIEELLALGESRPEVRQTLSQLVAHTSRMAIGTKPYVVSFGLIKNQSFKCIICVYTIKIVAQKHSVTFTGAI
jgi:uncharacterized protein YhdP